MGTRQVIAGALRVLVELGALVALGRGCLALGTGPAGVVLAVAVPALAAVAWAVFRVPADGGRPIVPVPGALRLALELILLGGATWALVAVGQSRPAGLLAAGILLQYALAHDRVRRLLAAGRPLSRRPGPAARQSAGGTPAGGADGTGG